MHQAVRAGRCYDSTEAKKILLGLLVCKHEPIRDNSVEDAGAEAVGGARFGAVWGGVGCRPYGSIREIRRNDPLSFHDARRAARLGERPIRCS